MLAARVALYEIRYLLRLPRTYVLFALLFSLGFLFSPMLDPRMFGAGSAANINSPFFVTAIHLACGFVVVLFLPPYLSASLRRDIDCQFDEILFSTPVSEGAYLAGRFLGAYVSLMLVFSGATLGMLFSNFWLLWTPASAGETDIADYAAAYFLFSAPTMLILAALVSSALVAFGRSTYAYAGVVVMLLCAALGSITRGAGALASAIDPFLVAAFAEQTRYWTPAELNSTAISYGAPVLQNRLLWIAVAAVSALLAWRSFSFRSAAARRTSRKTVLDQGAATPVAFSEPLDRGASPRWTAGTPAHQFRRLLVLELKAIFFGRPFLVFLVLSVIALYLLLPNVRAIYGAEVLPLTRLMIEAMFGVLSLPLAIVLIYGTGEIVWRERTCRVDEIVDSMPVPSWVLALSKFAALTVVLASIVVVAIAVAAAFQLSNGYSDLQLGTYIGRGFFFMFLPAVFFGGLALLGQALGAGRFLGALTIPLYALVALCLGMLGYNHPLSRLGSTIPAPLSDMSESGQFMSATYWLSLYWTFVTALLVLLACVLWNRGIRVSWRERLFRLRAFSNPGLAASAAAFVLLAVASASYVYYNTNVLNRYLTSEGMELRRLSYERQFGQYENLPRPRVTEIDVSLDLYPEQSRLSAKTSITLENSTAADLTEIHLDFPDVLQVSNVDLEGATLRSRDEDFVYNILALDPPMRPGETRSLSFDVSFGQRGFQAGGPSVGLVDNGSYLRYGDIAPHLGYNAGYAISDVNVRAKYGLAPLPPARRRLEEPDPTSIGGIAQDSDLVRFSATISTALDQIAVSAGRLERDWQEGDRRFFRYVLDGPSKVSFPFLSGRYRVADTDVDGIAVQILYHPTHAANIDRMRESIEDSLRYFSNAFGPYQFRQLRIVELPAYYDFVQSNAGTIVYSPGYGFITKPAGAGEVDVPYYVTAHEVAHQWWGHQIVTNNSQGDLLLSETLAQYSALLVMEEQYGKDLVRKFLKAELDLYLRGRGSDERGEVPLIRVEDQSYIYYRKGALVMYALRDYVGEDVVNSALRELVDSYAYRTTPYPTSRSFMEILREEAGPQYDTLIADLFERITLYDFHVRTAGVEELPDGRFRVTIDISVAKYYADATGQEVAARLDIPVDVGLFVFSPADSRFTGDHVIWLEKQVVPDGDSTIEVIVDRMPAFAGIDPYNKLIDRNSDDNLLRVGVPGTTGQE